MIKSLEASMLNLPHSVEVLAPLCAPHGIEAIGCTRDILGDEKRATEVDKLVKDLGLKWGLMQMPADFYHWDLDDEAFEKALVTLAKEAAVAEKIGATHAYNHVWSSGPREFDENFAWHVERVRRITEILSDHGVHYGLEFLGPHELRTWQKHEFVHSLAGVWAIADAAGGKAGIAFDMYHWYTSTNGCMDDVLFMAQHTDRLVALHMNDAVPGRTFDQQKDMERRLPMETGIIDARDILARFKANPNDALYMIEPFEPARTRFFGMTPEAAVAEAAEVFARLEK